MQAELNAEAANAPRRAAIAILGINAVGLESGNPSITAGRVLPWLQDVTEQEVWTHWQVGDLRPPDRPGIVWRDVVVLDASNRAVAVYNLTEHDLALPANYATLKQMLRDVAAR